MTSANNMHIRRPKDAATGNAAWLAAAAALAMLASCDGDWATTASALANATAPQARISDTANLTKALSRARDGDVILLEPGRYTPLNIQNLKFSKTVTLASRDPSRPAVLTGIKLRNVRNLVIKQMEFDVVPAYGMFSYTIFDSENVQLQQLNVHGTLNNDPSDDKSPIMIRGSRDISVVDSDFRELFHGISFLDSSHLHFSGNSFRFLRTDGIRGGGSSHIIIRGNVFTDFQPRPKDHPDGIQLWTTNTKAAARNVLIEQNVIARGKGAAIQGIFIRDTHNQFPFEELTIRNNLVLGGMFNGIAIGGSKDAVVENNVVAAFPDQKSWIRVGIAHDMLLSGNRATAYIFSPSARVQQKSNKKIAPVRDGGSSVLSRWMAEGENRMVTSRPLDAAGIR